MRAMFLGGTALAALGALLVLGQPTNAADAKAGQKVVVHLSKFTNDLHAASMAVKLASGMQEHGAEVTLFLDLEGVRLVDQGQPLDLAWGHGKPIGEVYEKFVKAGGKAWVCPHCAHAAGLQEESLRAGAKIADEGSIPAMLLQADKILDY